MTVGRFVAAAVVALAFSAPTAPARSIGSTAVFRARPDLRMCPSPLCGGLWVSRVNQATTTCADGATRSWCYVVGIDRAGSPSRPLVPAARQTRGLLVRGRIVRGGMRDFPSLGRLVATDAWLPATSAAWSGSVFLVTDTGVRCVRAPCFSLRASVVNTTRRVSASGLDLSPVGAAPALVRKAQAALTTGGLLVAGTTRRDAGGGRTVVAAQFFLRAG